MPQDPLSALFERPAPQLAVPVPARPPWWRAFGSGRLVAALLVAPLLWHEYAAQVGGWSELSWPWRLALLLVVVPAALTLATYLPQRGAARGGSPCAAMAGLTVVFAGIALSGAPLQVATLVLAAGLAGYGLLQRLRGADACAPRG